jgi:7,8-dihydroneopterin aldolase/epimerase/oxygenase
MTNQITICLNKVRFRAFHGLYAEERRTGNEFEVDLAVSIDASATITDLSATINYASLYQLLKNEMEKRRDILETFVMEVAGIIHKTFAGVKKVEISITKLQAPIEKFSGTVGVKYSREY